MARFEKSSPKSPSTDAAVAARKRQQKGSSIEDTMFFPRLRRHAKWMFVFLALVFGLGFVIFGVGAGGVGVGDVFRGGGSGGGQSVSDARKKTEERPNDSQAWRDLSTALQTEGDTDAALDALATAGTLAPKDADLQRELASLYLTQAGEKQTEAQTAQVEAAFGAATWNFPGALTANNAVVLEDPIGKAVNGIAGEKTSVALTAAQLAASNAVAALVKVAKLEPADPNVQLELASTAEQVNDTATAIAAYKRFLVLAPDDPNAPAVKQQLKLLQQASIPASG